MLLLHNYEFFISVDDIYNNPKLFEISVYNSDQYGPILKMAHHPLFWISISHYYKFRRKIIIEELI